MDFPDIFPLTSFYLGQNCLAFSYHFGCRHPQNTPYGRQQVCRNFPIFCKKDTCDLAKVLLIQFCKALLFMRCNIIIIFAKIYHKQQHWSRKCGMYRLFYFTFFLRNLSIRTFTFVLEQHRKKEIGDFACVAMDLFHFCPISFTSNFHQVYSLTNFNFMLDWLDGQGVDM